MRDRELARNTALLTASGLALRLAGMIWQVWLVGRVGEAGIGLFQLVMSVAALAATVAVSGSRFTATRLVSEELGLGQLSGAAHALRVCTLYGLFFGLAAGTALLFLAEPLGFLWLGDARTVAPLLLLALEMPLTGVDAVMHGYFTAVGRVWKSVLVSVGQQAAVIGLTMLFLTRGEPGNLEFACRAITLGRLAGAAVETAAMALVYIADRRKYGVRAGDRLLPPPDMTDRALTAAIPLALASYARSGLSTLQHLLVPVGLKASGLGAEAALAGYGVIQGMALPAVLFPSCVMLAAAELIVPKLTRQQVRREGLDIRDTAERTLRLGLLFSALCAAVFLSLGDALGQALYGSEEAGRYIRLFSLIVPVMYLDMLTDGCLKGLGEMMFCMTVNILDAGLSALLVWLFLPRWGLAAYVGVICFTELFNFVLSLGRLRRASGLRYGALDIPGIAARAVLAGAAGRLIYGISAGNGVPALIVSCCAAAAVYLAPELIRPGAGAGRRASE